MKVIPSGFSENRLNLGKGEKWVRPREGESSVRRLFAFLRSQLDKHTKGSSEVHSDRRGSGWMAAKGEERWPAELRGRGGRKKGCGGRERKVKNVGEKGAYLYFS